MAAWQDFAALATGGAAIATAVAAVFTASMAKQTKRSAEAAEDSVKQSEVELKLLEDQTKAGTTQAEVAQRVFARESTPLLVPVLAYEFVIPDNPNQDRPGKLFTPKVPRCGSWAFVDQANLLWFYVELRNVGRGVAVVGNLTEDLDHNLISGQIFSSAFLKPVEAILPGNLLILQPVIPAGESMYFVGCVDYDGQSSLRKLGERDSDNKAIFTYQDLSRTRTFQLSFKFSLIDNMLAPNQLSFTGYDLPEESNKG